MNDGPGGAEAAALELRDVVRTYSQAGVPLPVLRDVSFSLRRGEIVALVGPSGAGKSTLLHVAGLLEKPDGGTVWLDGRECGALSDQARTSLRGAALGFVYQFHHLLPEFSALENVMLPQMIAGVARGAARARALELLRQVGLEPRAEHRPARLSGGEQQRVAIVRALANRPRVLLGDEPTGNLDQNTAGDVTALLLQIVRGSGLTALIATHNLELAARMDRVLALVDGRVVERAPALLAR
jgi:lipoprotein-releasing system ATP-binding protein